MARTYHRDARGRFASGGGSSGRSRPATRQVQRGTNRLTRDNAGRITSVGGNGATARGGRLKTAAGNFRARQIDRVKAAPQGVVSRKGKVRGGTKPKARPAGWMQSPEARKDRVQYATDRRREAKFLKGQPRAVRQAIRAAQKAKGNDGGRYRDDIYRGRLTLELNSKKRKNKLSPGEISSIQRTMVSSARKLRAAIARPSIGGRLKRKVYETKAFPSQRRIAASRPAASGTVRGGTVNAKPARPQAPKPPAKPKSPATSRLRPGELMNANARPVNTMAKPRKGENPFGTKDQTKNKNLKIALDWLKAHGYGDAVLMKKSGVNGMQATAAVIPKGGYYKNTDGRYIVNTSDKPILALNAMANYWRNPAKHRLAARRSGFSATSSPIGTLVHEIGHMRDPRVAENAKVYGTNPFYSRMRQANRPTGEAGIWRRVSEYASRTKAEFIAETYAGLRTGRRYDHQVMRAYREAMGLSPRPAARRRSRLRR